MALFDKLSKKFSKDTVDAACEKVVKEVDNTPDYVKCAVLIGIGMAIGYRMGLGAAAKTASQPIPPVIVIK